MSVKKTKVGRFVRTTVDLTNPGPMDAAAVMEILGRAAYDAKTLSQRRGIIERNKKAAITPQERARAKELNQALLAEYPKKTPRYRAIAEAMQIRPDRVRAIIEGRRAKKR